MKIEKRKKNENVIEIQEETRIIQNDQKIILEKGDKIRVLEQNFDGEMTTAEIKDYTIKILKSVLNKTNEWSVRDTLTKLTNFGFYKGSIMASIDENLARDIIVQTLDYLENTFSKDPTIEEIYDVVYSLERYMFRR